ncbi:MAG: 4'-phosphopantetheinyl transferase superfamily protein [Bacteroidetes bacterium]|nr:4'-phosphopantetheinyl transferase superfamily protein [Bacteroidota bacterium]
MSALCIAGKYPEKNSCIQKMGRCPCHAYWPAFTTQSLLNLNLKIRLDDIIYTKEGRPGILSVVDFNISHSHQLVVCAVSIFSKVGIDVEHHHQTSIDEYLSFFPLDIQDLITASNTPASLFYRYWKIWEAVLKADGGGLSAGEKVKLKNHKIATLNEKEWFYFQVNILPDYTCHVTAKYDNISIRANEVVI